MLLENKRAVVTGAANGIGKAIAEVFLDQGAQVIGLDIAPAEADRAGLTLLRADLARPEDCRRAVEEITARWDRVDILVNCAGITRDAMTWRMTEDQWDQVLAVDLKAVWDLTRRIGPLMRKEQAGSIINISSAVGLFGNIGQANYAAAKAGLIGMTKTWAKEFSLGGSTVRVNAIAPGWTMTDMMKTVPEALLEQFRSQTMLGRLADPADIATAALFLASDLSGYITGQVLQVDGGLRM